MTSPHAYTEDQLRRAIRLNRAVLWLSRHWLNIALVILALYVGLALAAPVLMEVGAEGPANALYTLYSPLCHQFAFRSWFLFGHQHSYPRAVAGSDQASFESFAASDPHFAEVNLTRWTADLQLKSRSFKGNEEMGYKTALCERDIMIYAAMLLGGLLYSRVRDRLRPAPIWLYIFLGLGPIGVDGFSQLLSYPPFEFWPVRETLPAYRALTGALFGAMNIWLAFPYLQMSMRETMETVEIKLAQAYARLGELRAGGAV